MTGGPTDMALIKTKLEYKLQLTFVYNIIAGGGGR